MKLANMPTLLLMMPAAVPGMPFHVIGQVLLNDLGFAYRDAINS
jgi:hypothetical protein